MMNILYKEIVVANKKSRPCLVCSKMIWDTSIKSSSGMCKSCWASSRDYNISKATRVKQSEAMKKRWLDPEFRSEQSRKRREFLANPANHPNWRGGISGRSENRLARHTPEYKKFRKTILDRDQVCVLCGSDERLEVDHIKQWATHKQLRLDPTNCRVLCHDCHKQTPNYRRIEG